MTTSLVSAFATASSTQFIIKALKPPITNIIQSSGGHKNIKFDQITLSHHCDDILMEISKNVNILPKDLRELLRFIHMRVDEVSLARKTFAKSVGEEKNAVFVGSSNKHPPTQSHALLATNTEKTAASQALQLQLIQSAAENSLSDDVELNDSMNIASTSLSNSQVPAKQCISHNFSSFQIRSFHSAPLLKKWIKTTHSHQLIRQSQSTIFRVLQKSTPLQYLRHSTKYIQIFPC